MSKWVKAKKKVVAWRFNLKNKEGLAQELFNREISSLTDDEKIVLEDTCKTYLAQELFHSEISSLTDDEKIILEDTYKTYEEYSKE